MEKPRAEKRGVWSRAGERDLSLGIFFFFFLEILVAPPRALGRSGNSNRSSSLLAGPGRRRGPAWRSRRRLQPGPAHRKPLPPRRSALAPPPFPLPPPSPPPPGPLPRAPRHPRALARAPPPFAHTHGRLAAKFRLRPPLQNPAAVIRAVTLNFPSAVTHSPLSPPARPLAPPSPPFLKKHFTATTTTPIQPTPNLRAPPSPRPYHHHHQHRTTESKPQTQAKSSRQRRRRRLGGQGRCARTAGGLEV